MLGRIDPRSGAIREYPTSIPDSGPHGLTADAAGHVWFTANYASYIGRLDPASGQITEYRMPDPEARDPHTPVFDQSGVLWFSVQGGNMIGRLDPRSGEVRLIKDCPKRRHGRAGSPSILPISSGTPTTPVAASAGLIPRAAQRANGPHPEVRAPSPTASPCWMASSGTANRG